MRAAIAVGILLGAGVALAHGDATWIMENPATAYCCGVSDCERAPRSAVRDQADGSFLVVSTGQVFRPGDADLHDSRDEYWWWCRPPYLGGQVKCLFQPRRGS